MINNAKYISPQIQNEVIEVMASMVQEIVIDECKHSDLGVFCIKCDDTRDATNTECMSLVLRFVSKGVANDRLLSLVDRRPVDAPSITTASLRY